MDDIKSKIKLIIDNIYNQDKSKIIEILKLDPLSNIGGLSSFIFRLQIKINDKSDESYKIINMIGKSTKETDLVNGKFLGKAREGLFFSDLYKEIDIPKLNIYYSEGDMENCYKLILMEDLSESSYQGGYLFGKHSPHNWDKDIESITIKDDNKPSLYQSAKIAFETIAMFHKKYWNNAIKLNKSYLKGSEWYQNKGKESWEQSQNMVKDCWIEIKQKIIMNQYYFKWSKSFIDIIDSSINKINWDNYQKEINSKAFTLIHGDFHPANTLWKYESIENYNGYFIILDYEVVGIGNPAQDLGQFLISHINSKERLPIENDLLEAYYKKLIENTNIDKEYSFQELKNDYIDFSSRRWIWLFIIITYYYNSNQSWIEYFYNQLNDFFNDHKINEINVNMPSP